MTTETSFTPIGNMFIFTIYCACDTIITHLIDIQESG
jgi:hypothetical protein